MKTSELLEKTVDWLEEHEWIQGGTYRKRDGEEMACLAGALMRVYGGQIVIPNTDLERAFAYLVSEVGGATFSWGIADDGGAEYINWGAGVTRWNDTPRREKGEVLDALRNAAKRAREDEVE